MPPMRHPADRDPLGVPRFFPPARQAGPSGLVLVGGALTPERLLDAYRHGIFPWPVEGGVLAWWSPPERGVLPFERFHVSRRLARTCRSGRFELTENRAFAEVVRGCASSQERAAAVWLTSAMQEAYLELHRLGWAHSVEAWRRGQLAGGVYGVAIGGLFAAESMFYRERDASKVALCGLMQRLRERGFVLVDVQMATPHTARLGVVSISRDEYLARLAAALRMPARFG